MKTWSALLLALSIISAFLLGTRFPEMFRHPQSPSVLEQQTQKLNLQRMCADQADKSFKMVGYVPKPNVLNSYFAHYNFRLGRCFMVFHTWDTSNVASTGSVSTFESIEEPFEGTDYGDYFQSHETKDVIPIDRYVDCHIEPPGEKRTVCKSEEQWNALKSRFMRD